MRTSLPKLAAALLVSSVLLGGSEEASGQTTTLRLHTFTPAVVGSYQTLNWWRQKVEQESNGTLKIQMFGTMQLGGAPTDLYDQVKNGVVDIAWTLPSYNAGLFPRTAVFELPFIGDTAEISSVAIDDYVRGAGKDDWSDVHVLVANSGGNGIIHTKNRAVRTLEDFRGLKLRTPGSIASLALSQVGAAPVPIPGLKLTEAFMNNIVDGIVTTWTVASATKVLDIANYHTESTLNQPVAILLMNKDVYKKLSGPAKAAIDANTGRDMARQFGIRWMNDDKPGAEKALKLKHEVIRIEGETEKKWRAAMQPVYESWIKETNAAGLPGKDLVAAAEALIAKYRTKK